MLNNIYNDLAAKPSKARIRVKGSALSTKSGIRICKVSTAIDVIQGKEVIPLLKELIFNEVRVC